MANYYMDGRHKTKVHIRVKTVKGSTAWCGTHSSYSKDVIDADIFTELPAHRQCKRCLRAVEKGEAK